MSAVLVGWKFRVGMVAVLGGVFGVAAALGGVFRAAAALGGVVGKRGHPTTTPNGV